MNATLAAQEHIEALANKSLRTYEDGFWQAAISGFLKGLKDHNDTSVLLTRHPNLYQDLWEAAAMGSEEFHQKMLRLRLDFEIG